MALISNSELYKKSPMHQGTNDEYRADKEVIRPTLAQSLADTVDKKNKNIKIPTAEEFQKEIYKETTTGAASGKIYDAAGRQVDPNNAMHTPQGYLKNPSKRTIKENERFVNATTSDIELDLRRFYNFKSDDVVAGKGALYFKQSYGRSSNDNRSDHECKVIDADWVRSRFMAPSYDLEEIDASNRFFSSSGWKFGSTRMGHNMAINPRPQFTRFADIKGNNRSCNFPSEFLTPDGKIAKRPENGEGVEFYSIYDEVEVKMKPPKEKDEHGYGMGRYYSEAIDDNATTVFLQFGLPKFNSLINYFTRAIDAHDNMVANYGRVPLGYTVGRFLGGYIMFCAFPLMTILIWTTKAIFDFVASGPFNFYYMQPAMTQYWATVNVVLSQLATELGILSPRLDLVKMDNSKDTADKIGTPTMLYKEDIKDLAKYMPKLIDSWTGNIDVFSVAGMAQHLANRMQQQEYEQFEYMQQALENGYKVSPGAIKGFVETNSTKSYKRFPSGDLFAEANVKCSLYYLIKLVTSRKGQPKPLPDKILGSEDITADEKDQLEKRYNDVKKYMEIDKRYHDKNDETGKRDKSKRMGNGMYSYEVDATGRPQVPKDESGEKEPNPNDDADVTNKRITKEEQEAMKANMESQDKKATLDENGDVKADKDFAGMKRDDDGRYSALNDDDESLKAKFKGWISNIADMFDSGMRDGGNYAIFNVDYQGSQSESVSNSVSDIETGGLINSVSQASRNMKFNLSGGNLLGDVQKEIVTQVASFAQGAVESMSYGFSNVVRTLMGGAMVDIPKKWDDSDISLPSITYNITLACPYGNVFSQIQNIYLPLSMLIAGAFPLATGKASYTSPFLCSVFNKGVQDIPLGMITSLSINRGTGNMGFSRYKKALQYEVSFQVTDFSTLITAPIKASAMDEIFNFSMDDDTPFGRYMGVIASRDLYTNKYFAPRLKKKLSRMMMAASQTFSSGAIGMRVGHMLAPVFALFSAERSMNITQVNNWGYSYKNNSTGPAAVMNKQ